MAVASNFALRLLRVMDFCNWYTRLRHDIMGKVIDDCRVTLIALIYSLTIQINVHTRSEHFLPIILVCLSCRDIRSLPVTQLSGRRRRAISSLFIILARSDKQTNSWSSYPYFYRIAWKSVTTSKRNEQNYVSLGGHNPLPPPRKATSHNDNIYREVIHK